MSVATRFRIGKPLHDRGLLAGNCIMSGLITGRGFALDGDGIGHILTAITAAIMITLAMYVYWRWLLDRVAHAIKPTTRVLAVCSLLIVGPAIFFGSTWFAVVAMRGEAALETHMHRSVETAGADVASSYQRVGSLDSLVEDIRIEAAFYRNAAREERTSGAYTGTAGDGAVAQALDAIAERLEQLASAIQRAVENRDGLADEAEALLASMRETIGSDGPVPERMRALAQQYDRLRRILADIASGDISGTIDRTLDRLPALAETHVPLSGNPAVAADQRGALARIHRDLTNTSEVLGADVAALQESAETGTPGVEVITAYDAVGRYRDQFWTIWAAATAMDFVGPLAIAVFLLLSVSEKSREQLATDRALHLEVVDLIDSGYAQEIMRSVAMHQDVLVRTNARLQGKDGERHGQEISHVD